MGVPRLIAGGAWTRIVIDGDVIGLVSGASYDEDWGIQPAKVLNFLGPIDYDSQDYSCRLTLQTFIPEPGVAGPWADGGTKTLADLLPNRKSIQSNNGRPQMFATVQFLSTSSGQVLNQFEKVIVASNGVQIAPNSFVTANISLMAVDRTK